MSDIKPAIKAYSELQQAYDWFNLSLFDKALPDLLITLQRGRNTFGYFAPERFTGESSVSELAMNPDYFGGRSLAVRWPIPCQHWCMKWCMCGSITPRLKNAGAAIMIAYGVRKWRKSGLCHQIPAYLAGKRTGSR